MQHGNLHMDLCVILKSKQNLLNPPKQTNKTTSKMLTLEGNTYYHSP